MRIGHGNLPILSPMYDEKRTRYAVGKHRHAKILNPANGVLHLLCTGDEHELKCGRGCHAVAGHASFPDTEVVVDRTPSHGRFEPLLERRRTRHVVAAKAAADDADAIRVDLPSRDEIVNGGGYRVLIIKSRIEFLITQCLTDTWRVDKEAVEPSLHELLPRSQEPQLLGRIEPANENQGGMTTGFPADWHEIGWQCRAVIRHQDAFQRIGRQLARTLEGLEDIPVRGEPPGVGRWDKVLTDGVVQARQEQVLARCFPRAVLRAARQCGGDPRPFPMPGFIVADGRLQARANQGHIAELSAGGERKQRVVRPPVVSWEKFKHVGFHPLPNWKYRKD